MSVRIIIGDCRDALKSLPSESVHCVVTSPPYWGLRDYGVAGQIGLELTPAEFIDQMVAVFREVHRVLRSDGTLWLNLGDSYANDGKFGGKTGGKQSYLDEASLMRNGREKRVTGLKPKDMVGIPWRVAFALQADGWYLRRDIIWHKLNPLPESVRDRPSTAHEYLFLLSKNGQYYYDADAILEPVSANTHARLSQDVANQVGSERANGGGKTNGNMKAVGRGPKTQPADSGIKNNESFAAAVSLPVTHRNKRSVWATSTEAFSEAHFATFPPALIEPCIKAGCPEGGGGPRPLRRRGDHGPRGRPAAPQRHPDRDQSRIRRHSRATHRHGSGHARRCADRIAAGDRMTRHSWPKQGATFPNKTERECLNGCGIVKVSRREFEGGRDVYWTEFWRDLERIECEGTPLCTGPARAVTYEARNYPL